MSIVRSGMLVLAALALPQPVLAEAPDVIRKVNFYRDTSLGEFAWLPYAQGASLAEVKNQDRYVALSGLDCVVLPRKRNLVFVINHQSDGEVSGQAYAAVRILKNFSHSLATTVYWSRRGDWISDSGRLERDRQSSTNEVVAAEALRANRRQSNSTRQAVQDELDEFHARVALSARNGPAPGKDTWDDRDFFSDRFVPSDTPISENTQLNYLNMRFSFSDSSSKKPLWFATKPAGAKSLVLMVDIPGHTSDAVMSAIEIRFGSSLGECE